MPHDPDVDSPVRRAAAALGIRSCVLGIHDPAFPGADGEDVGRGTPYGAGGRRLAAFAAALGFDGLQLGPQGLTFHPDSSPYDGTLFSRSPLSTALRPLAEPEWDLLRPATLEALVRGCAGGAAERVAATAAAACVEAALREAWATFRAGGGHAALAARLREFRRRQASWLQADALYAALYARHGGRHWPEWRDERGSPHPDRGLWGPGGAALRRQRLREHAEAVEAYCFGQFLVHEQHDAWRRRLAALGLRLFGDLQVGTSPVETWAHPGLFLAGYRLGAPPSRTNPEGQPWNYPVLDPRLYRDPAGPARRFLRARFGKMLSEYDAVRIDHPHGLVCPWVYRADAPDPGRAVREGARLFESPDLPDHPALAGFALVAPRQLRPQAARHADDWVAELTPAQVDRYAVWIDALVALARRSGRDVEDLPCEVLSTRPLPLARVLERHGLGGFRVTQKAALDDPRDGYRGENAQPQDWIMLGNHDTPSIWSVAEGWVRAGLGRRHAERLAGRLRPPDPEAWIPRTAADPRALARAAFAELFVGPARHVFVFFTDLFGFTASYNRPGIVDADNWVLRLPPDFERLYAERRGRGAALDLPRALAAALRARGPGFAALHSRLLEQLERD